MTRKQVLSLTYPFPPQGSYRECHLRLIGPLVTPGFTISQKLALPPQVAFEGPWDVDELQRGLRWRDEWRNEIQGCLEEGSIQSSEVELLERAAIEHLDAVEKAILMAEAGWKIYIQYPYVAVLVRPE